MATLKKGFRKIVRGDRVFYWCVKNDNKDDDRLYLVIKSADKKFLVSYMLEQKNTRRTFSPKKPFIIVKGTEFKGIANLTGFSRFLVPDWEDDIITPSLVGSIIDWCLTKENAVLVDYNGDIIS